MPTPAKRFRKSSPEPRYKHSDRSKHASHSRERRDHGRERELKDFRSESSDRRSQQQQRLHSKPREESHSDHKSNRRRERKRPSNPFLKKSDEDKHEWGKPSDNVKTEKTETVIKPDFGLSGKLAEDTNTVNGIVIKYNEPSEARKPKRRWRLYPFKGEESLPVIPIHRLSAYLIGRSRGLVDIPTDHPSCSKQQAVLQYRLVEYQRDDGRLGKRVRPYLIDLESANGTFVNNKKIDTKRYVELFEKDVLKFGYSSREYVILHEDSKVSDDDDNVDE